MYTALPRASRVSVLRSRPPSYTTSRTAGPNANEATVPNNPTLTTTSIRRRNPARNSSRSFWAASRAKRGRSAACTAWNKKSGTRASSTPLPKRVTFSASSLAANTSMAIGPAFTNPAPITEPRRSQPRLGVTSLHGASGPGLVTSWRRAHTIRTPDKGERATRSAYAPTLVTSSCHKITQPTTRTKPSAPITMPYAAKRPSPEQMPRARWVGAYDMNAIMSAAVTSP